MPRITLLLLSLLIWSCSKNRNTPPDLYHEALVESVEQSYIPIGNSPIEWPDSDLQFLDAFADKQLIGLGEATHGTSEFFEAKHRIFQYLVENHGYRIFAIEADFGESLFINEAIQAGDKAAIEDLMIDKMHFWTWRTTEVKALLEWMCEYNINKAENERLQYVGVDCQFNTYHPDLVISFLNEHAPDITPDYQNLLSEIKEGTDDSFSSYSDSSVNGLLLQLEALTTSFINMEEALTTATSPHEYQLHLQLLHLCRQATVVKSGLQISEEPQNNRDRFMATNTLWWLSQFDDSKAVLWAHNAHISRDPIYDAIGYHLTQNLGELYTPLGFSFSRGRFTAYRPGLGLVPNTIEDNPVKYSMNGILDQTEASTFVLAINDLEQHSNWDGYLDNNALSMLMIGSRYQGNSFDYYRTIKRDHYDWLIYFSWTGATKLF